MKIDDDSILGLTARLGALVGAPHEPTRREIADIEREPVFTAPPVDPIAHLRKAVEDNIREPHRKIVILWLENAFLLGGIDQGKRTLARMDARGFGK